MTSSLIDVVVSDYRMPEMNGYELPHQVRRHYPKTIRIMLTGQSDRATYSGSHQPVPLLHGLHRYRSFYPATGESYKLDDMLSDKQAQGTMNGLISFADLPETYRQLTALLDQPEVDLAGIVNLGSGMMLR